jgi:hypothetical protein
VRRAFEATFLDCGKHRVIELLMLGAVVFKPIDQSGRSISINLSKE